MVAHQPSRPGPLGESGRHLDLTCEVSDLGLFRRRCTTRLPSGKDAVDAAGDPAGSAHASAGNLRSEVDVFLRGRISRGIQELSEDVASFDENVKDELRESGRDELSESQGDLISSGESGRVEAREDGRVDAREEVPDFGSIELERHCFNKSCWREAIDPSLP